MNGTQSACCHWTQVCIICFNYALQTETNYTIKNKFCFCYAAKLLCHNEAPTDYHSQRIVQHTVILSTNGRADTLPELKILSLVQKASSEKNIMSSYFILMTPTDDGKTNLSTTFLWCGRRVEISRNDRVRNGVVQRVNEERNILPLGTVRPVY